MTVINTEEFLMNKSDVNLFKDLQNPGKQKKDFFNKSIIRKSLLSERKFLG